MCPGWRRDLSSRNPRLLIWVRLADLQRKSGCATMFLSVSLELHNPVWGEAQKFCRRFCFCAGSGFDLETESCSGLESQSFTLGGSTDASYYYHCLYSDSFVR